MAALNKSCTGETELAAGASAARLLQQPGTAAALLTLAAQCPDGELMAAALRGAVPAQLPTAHLDDLGDTLQAVRRHSHLRVA